MKKVNKKNLPLRENSLPLRPLFCGQTASSLRPYRRSGQIICIGFTLPQLDKPCFASLYCAFTPALPRLNSHLPKLPLFSFLPFPMPSLLRPPPFLAHFSLLLFLLFLPSLSPFASLLPPFFLPLSLPSFAPFFKI